MPTCALLIITRHDDYDQYDSIIRRKLHQVNRLSADAMSSVKVTRCRLLSVHLHARDEDGEGGS